MKYYKKMNILVVGFYNRSNLGDDMFMEIIPKFFENGYNLKFETIDDIDYNSLDIFDSVIVGGGDLINNYFHKKLLKLKENFNGQIIAFGVGIPYFELISKGYIDIFDYFFTRTFSDVRRIQHRIGSDYGNYLPDLGFKKLSFEYDENVGTKYRDGKYVGIFLMQTVFKISSIVYELTMYIEKLCVEYPYKFILFSFNTSENKNENDATINKHIYDSLKFRVNNLEIDDNVYSTDEMLSIMKNLEFSVCSRFHSHVFSIVSHCPFVSICFTRKVERLMYDENLSELCHCVTYDENYKPSHLDLEQMFLISQYVNNNKEIISKKLKYISEMNFNLLDNCKIQKIIQKNKIRSKDILPIENFNIDNTFSTAKSYLGDFSNHEDIVKCAEYMCMNITNTPRSKYVYGTIDNLLKNPENLREMIKWIREDYKNNYFNSIVISNFKIFNQHEFKGLHRSGWQYVVEYMEMCQGKFGPICDVYLDRSFHWACNVLVEEGILPYTSPWFGFVHHCPNTQYTEYNLENMIKNKYFVQSLRTCKGIIFLSEYLKDWFTEKFEILGYEKVPFYFLYHPTQIPDVKFDIEKYSNSNNKRLCNIGAWYRNPFSIYRINTPPDIKKYSLKGLDMGNYFFSSNLKVNKDVLKSPNEFSNKWNFYFVEFIKENYNNDKIDFELIKENDKLKIINNGTSKKIIEELDNILSSVRIIDRLENDDYDVLLSENVVFLDLVDCSAANTVIECIVRNTPLITRRFKPLEEYLGKDYPLFYDSLDEVSDLLNIKNISNAHYYLSKKDKTFLTIENFIYNFRSIVHECSQVKF